MMNEKYYVELDKLNKLLERKNKKTDFYNGIYDRYEYPVLTREMIPLTWRYDLNPETNPYFIERLGVNAVMNSGAIYLNGKYYLVARIEGNDRKSFFGVAESDNGIDGFRFWDYPILLDDVCPEETNVYDMRLTQHEDGWIYGVFCSESKDTTVNDLSAAVAAAGIVRTKDLKHWERLDNLKTLRSPQQRNVVLHPEFVDGKYAFYTRPMDDFIETGSGSGIGFGLCDDIAHALSLTCRGGGHVSYFFSVAQHSINCMNEAKARGWSERLQLACLLHDASEAYISDIIRPVKAHLSNYLEIESSIMNVILERFGLADLSEEENAMWKQIDDDMMNFELKNLMKGEEYRNTDNLSSVPAVAERPWREVEDEFEAECKKLAEKMSDQTGK